MIQELTGVVRYSETDEKGRLALPSLVNYFQDVAEYHSSNLGIGYRYLKERGRAWLISSWQIEIDRMPDLSEPYILQTWGWKFQGIFGMRNCVLLDENRKALAWADSAWFLYDLEARRPLRVPQDMIDRYGVEPRLDMKKASRKVPDFACDERDGIFTVSRQNLDTNHHVNNAQYVAFAQGALPEEEEVRGMQIEYRKQAYLGDVIVPCLQRWVGSYGVSLRDLDGETYANAIFETR